MNGPARKKDRAEDGDDSRSRSSAPARGPAVMRGDVDADPDEAYGAPTVIQAAANNVLADLKAPATEPRGALAAREPTQHDPSHDGGPGACAASVAPPPVTAVETPLLAVGSTGVPCLHDDYRSSAHIRLGPSAPMSAVRAASATLAASTATTHVMVDRRHWYLVRVALVAEGAVILSLLIAVAILLWK